MVPATGAGAVGVPAETQMLLLESRSDEAGSSEGNVVYALMLPVLEGGFRASLQGSPEDELQFCFESGELRLLRPMRLNFEYSVASTCEILVISERGNKWWCCPLVGDPDVQTAEAVDAVFINSGDNPFKLLKESIK